MKKVLYFLLLSAVLVSCSKEEQAGIVGTWKETACYAENAPGVYAWVPATRFPLQLTFKPEGAYSSSQEMFISEGLYNYHPGTKELVFTSTSSGDSTTEIVSFLDRETLEIDYLTNGVLLKRLRFTRKQ